MNLGRLGRGELLAVLGGLLLALGLLTPLAAVLIVATMVVAVVTVHWTKGVWNADGGYELNLVYVVTVLAVTAIGDGVRGGVSGWEAPPILHWLLLAAAAAPLILAWVIVRDHQLGWPRGEMTAVVGMIAFVLVAYAGLVDRPGTPSSQISLKPGWFVTLAGCGLCLAGGALRAGSTERPRKPPGVL
jgi:hypothetical protein